MATAANYDSDSSEEKEEKPDNNSSDSKSTDRPTFHRTTSVDDVSGQAPAIVTAFLGECFRNDGLPVPPELDENQQRINKDVAHAIRDIGDRLSNDHTLNNMIGQVRVSKDSAFDTFLIVAQQIFADGVYNWGRIVTLFYFGYKLAVRVVNEIPLVKMIIEWVVKFIKDRLAKWIFEQGGWEALLDHIKNLRERHNMEFLFTCGLAVSILGLIYLWRRP